MSKPLLQRNSLFLLTWLPVVLLVCLFAFYVLLRLQGDHMQEEQLLLKQRNVLTTFINKSGNMERHIEGEYSIDEMKDSHFAVSHQSRDTAVYYDDQKKSVPFQILSRAYTVNNRNYLVTTYVSSTEIAHLIIKVFIAQFLILILLMMAIVFLNRKSAVFLWQPFFSAIKKLKEYDIKTNQLVELPDETGTTEFDQLNKTAAGLISNSNTAYHQQKQFVENASHEIQTPLAIIRSKLELLINQPNLTEKQASLLGDITEANERLSLMNRTLLLLAKIENNHFPETEAVHVSPIVEQMIATFQNHYDDFPELDMDLQPNVVLTANRSLIEILLSNLITNAIVHNVPGGKIIINLSLSGFLIENTGPPLDIEPEELFGRFKKGSHTTKTTGLGLAIVRQVCNLYHYPVSYQSSNGWHRITVSFA